MSDKLIVSWEEYNKTVENLAIQIHDSGYKPTLLVGIMPVSYTHLRAHET